MRAPRTRALAAVLGTAMLVPTLAPAVSAAVSPGELTLQADPILTTQHEQSVTLTVHFEIEDATGTVTFWRTFLGTPESVGTATLSGDTATLITDELPVGYYDIYATYEGDAAYLAAGPSNPVSVGIKADESVKVGPIALQYERFYPRRDGYRDTDRISGATLEPADVSVRIYTSGGTRVKSFLLGTKDGPYSVTWDGRKKDGSLFAQGTYTVRHTFRDLQGNTSTSSQPVILSHKKLYWHVRSQTRYADTGAFFVGGGAVAAPSTIFTRGVQIYGGSTEGGEVFGRYTFTLPAAVLYSSLRVSVYGKSNFGPGDHEAFGRALAGFRSADSGPLDAFTYVGFTTGWYSRSVAAAAYVTSDHKVKAWTYADQPSQGYMNYQKVELAYKYALLED